jgi:hypothetical protein
MSARTDPRGGYQATDIPTATRRDLPRLHFHELFGLALVHLEMGNMPQAKKEIEESVGRARMRWQATPDLAGDSLARALFIAAHIQSVSRQASPTICQLLREARTAAHDPEVKRFAESQLSANCATEGPPPDRSRHGGRVTDAPPFSRSDRACPERSEGVGYLDQRDQSSPNPRQSSPASRDERA